NVESDLREGNRARHRAQSQIYRDARLPDESVLLLQRLSERLCLVHDDRPTQAQRGVLGAALRPNLRTGGGVSENGMVKQQQLPDRAPAPVFQRVRIP